MTVSFELDGQGFVALNGGTPSKFTESISFVVNCNTQQEVDEYWEKLSTEGGGQKIQCGWLKDKYGISWQVMPIVLIEMISYPDPKKSQQVFEAMLQMEKIDIEKLEQTSIYSIIIWIITYNIHFSTNIDFIEEAIYKIKSLKSKVLIKF
jgi:predicted 3-demethylubiquinone-9 3-methyltransferase (glyoxalase superfamily)